MFGLESKKDKGNGEFIFELEKELKDSEKGKTLVLKIDDRIQQIKNALRGGEDKEVFDKLGLLLYGYASILKVISRATTKQKKK